MIIPPERLSDEALQSILEAYINREGTDYGEREIDLSVKVDQLKSQLRSGEVCVVFDASSESVNLMTSGEYQQWSLMSETND